MGTAACLAQELDRELSSSPHRQKPREHTTAGDGAAEAPRTSRQLQEGRASGRGARQGRGSGGAGCPPAQTSLQCSCILFIIGGPAPRARSRIRGCLNFNWRARVPPYPTSSCLRCCHGTPSLCAGAPALGCRIIRARQRAGRAAGMRQRGAKQAALVFAGF